MKYINILVIFFLTVGAVQAQGLGDRSRGNKFNPDIGLNGLLLFKNSVREVETDGFDLQELELQFSSDVDAYFRAEATIALHKEEAETEGEHSHEFKVHPEEVFIETINLKGVTIKGGKFYAEIGKYNSTHTHALPFIYRSKLHEDTYGEEGLAEVGMAVSYLVPVNWFFDVTAQVLQPTNEALFVDSHHSPAYLLKMKNLFEMGDSSTLEIGLSGLKHANHGHGTGAVEEKTDLLGADMTFKWRPTEGGKTSSFVWSTEFLHKDRAGTNIQKTAGVTTFMRYQLGQRWYVQGQYEHLGFTKNEDVKVTNAYAGLIGFVPTEFSSLRLQYDQVHDGLQIDPEKRISLQLNFSIGAHPAHTY